MFYFLQNIGKELKVKFGMNTANDVYFRNRLAIIFLYQTEHIISAQFPSFLLMSIEPRIRTEITTKNTNIGWLDVKVPVEVGFVAMQFFPDVVSQ